MTPLFCVDLTFEWYEGDMVFRVFFCCYFCLEPTVRKNTWMRTTSVTVMVIFFESGILKVTYYVQSPFSTITRHIDNSILKDTLEFFILWTLINMRAKSFVKTSVNVTETRIDEGAWKKIVAQSVHLEEHCTKAESTFHLFYEVLFLTNPVDSLFFFFFFLIMSTTMYLIFCLLINI